MDAAPPLTTTDDQSTLQIDGDSTKTKEECQPFSISIFDQYVLNSGGGDLAFACSDVTRTFHEVRDYVKANDITLADVSRVRHKRAVEQLMSVLDGMAAVPPGKRTLSKFCAAVVTATSAFHKEENLTSWSRRWCHVTLKTAKTDDCCFCAHASRTLVSMMGKTSTCFLNSPIKKVACLECYDKKETKHRRFFMNQDLLSEVLVEYNVLPYKTLLAADVSLWIKLGDAVGAVKCSTCAAQAVYVFFESRNLACEACFDKLCAEKDSA
jgi:hypothetical protein